jgi:MiaB-like tRNA modifying enzyme, archaeal-type
MNYGEGAQLSERMSAMGHVEVDSADSADIVILNTCTVVDTTEKKMIRRMSELRSAGKEVIVTGCMAKVQANRINIRLPDSMVIAPDRYPDFSDIVSEKYDPPYTIPVGIKTNIIPIAQGCLGNCTYCITKFARGGLMSYPPDMLTERFNKMIDSGIKEILITAQDTGCYGFDIGTTLPSLIRMMLRKDGEYRIRIGMMNPDNLNRMLDDLLDVMNDPRVYRFLHIPVQSGSDSVLKKMNRRYTVNDFMRMVDKSRLVHPDISISTDMISGFPEETDEDHRKSIELVRQLEADTINITRFSARPGTEAALMQQVHGRVCKDRSAELTDTKNDVEYSVNEKLIGKTFRALVAEHGKPGTMIARTDNYRPVAIESDLPIGSFTEVEVTGCAPTYLVGRVLNK